MKLFLYSVLCCSSVYAQMPETDIWLMKLEKKEGKYVYANPLNINNRKGYDNQPVFTPDGKSILYVTVNNDNQADIVRYDIKSKLHTNISKSKVSEYSPGLLPSGIGMSAVVVEADSTQRVWLFGFDGSFNKICSEQTDSVGYYSWLSNDTLLYYKLTEPHSLRALQVSTGKDVWICDKPTRAFKRINNGNKFIYGIKDSASVEFRIYDPVLRQSVLYSTYPSPNEDFIWHPELGLVKTENADILRYNEKSKSWETLFSFSALGIKKITRFVFDSKTRQLAIVSNL